jgi:hypothetical protein
MPNNPSPKSPAPVLAAKHQDSLNVPMVTGTVQVHGGDTNIVVKLSATNNVRAAVPPVNGQVP